MAASLLTGMAGPADQPPVSGANWYSRKNPGTYTVAGQDSGNGTSSIYANTLQSMGPGLSDYATKNLGYTGASTHAFNNATGEWNPNAAGQKQFDDWQQQTGYSPAVTGAANNEGNQQGGWVGADNNVIPGSEWKNGGNDNQFWTGAMLAGGLVSGGAAAGTGLGSAGTGAVAGGTSGFIKDGTAKSALTGAAMGAAGGAAKDYFTGAPTGYPIDSATASPGYRNQMDLASDAYSPAAQTSQVSPGGLTPSTGLQPEMVQNTSPPTAVNEPGNFNPPSVPPLADASLGQAPLGNAGPNPGSLPPMSAASGLGALGDFAKANPQLTAGLAGGALSALNGGNGGSPPSIPGSDSSGGSNQTTIDALTHKLYGNIDGAFDYSKVPGLQTNAGDPSQYYKTAADAAYDRQKQYLDPQVTQQQASLEARLGEQGFVPGTPGYARAMQTFQDTNNRSYAAARDSAIQQGVAAGQGIFSGNLQNANLNNTASNSTLDQMLRQRNQPINELNALKTGQQVQYQNGIDQYNANVASKNSTNQTIGQLGTAAAIYFSDARLKEDILPIGQTAGGAKLYSYSIFGRRETGVLAQELAQTQPDAVSLDPESGFFIVDYSKVR